MFYKKNLHSHTRIDYIFYFFIFDWRLISILLLKCFTSDWEVLGGLDGECARKDWESEKDDIDWEIGKEFAWVIGDNLG